MGTQTTIESTAADEQVQRISSNDVPWLPYDLIPNSYWRVLNVDEQSNIVILNFKMAPWTTTPVHGHHCTATAFTQEGEWFYDDLSFKQGDIAFETTVEVHQPITKDRGATLLTTLIGGVGNDKLLENFNDDGSTVLLRTRFFKACERMSVEEYAKIDLMTLIN